KSETLFALFIDENPTLTRWTTTRGSHLLTEPRRALPRLFDGALGKQVATVQLYLRLMFQAAQRARAVFANETDAVNVDAKRGGRAVEKARADAFEQFGSVARQPTFDAQNHAPRILVFRLRNANVHRAMLLPLLIKASALPHSGHRAFLEKAQ